MTRKIRQRTNHLIQSQMVDGIFRFGYNPENQVLTSEESVTTDASDEVAENVEPYYPEPLPSLNLLHPSTPPSSSSNPEQHVMPSIRELIDQFLNENPGTTEYDYFDMDQISHPFSNPEPVASNTDDVDLDDVEMQEADGEITVEEAIQFGKL